jgi:hypothetical protein
MTPEKWFNMIGARSRSQAAVRPPILQQRDEQARVISQRRESEIALKTLLFVLILSAVTGPAHAQFLQVTGATGYLSEWEVNGSITETISGRVREFSGPLTVRHIGLCSQVGPEEKVAEIKFQIVKSSLWPHFRATMTMDGAKCTFSGKFSDTYSGFMDCTDAKGVPVTLSIK